MSGKTSITKEYTTEALFAAFAGLKVLVIGDVMIDSYLWGRVDRISPEAPVPILQVENREARLGGAANVALNVQALGAVPYLCAVVGDDLDGNNFLSLLEQNNLPAAGIYQSKERITTIKHRIISGHHHLLRVDQETDKPLVKNDKQQLLTKITALLDTCDVIIFEDYDKGVIDEELITAVVKLAKAKGIPTVVDPKKRNFLHYKHVTLFKPNRKEMKEGLKWDGNLLEDKDIEAAVDNLSALLNSNMILLTLSEKGVFIKKERDPACIIPAHIRKIADVSGAGDTVVSVAALCCALNLAPDKIAQLSNLAGGLVCEQVGVVPIDKKLLQEEATLIWGK
ncbi:MAG: rfaE [Chitinophagaceae bacterium]|nr:rfaE [Chitinophagaceae bacterium]